MTRPVARPGGAASRGARRGRGDSGAANSIAVALLAPLFVLLAFAAVQAALWNHARTEARVVARDTAALVARSGMSAGDAQSAAAAVLRHDTDLSSVRVSVAVNGDLVRVVVSGEAPGLLRGTTNPVRVVEAVPMEEMVP